MKEWTFKKGNCDCVLKVFADSEDVRIKVLIDNISINCDKLEDRKVFFSGTKKLNLDGTTKLYKGLTIENEYEEMKTYYEELKCELKETKEREYKEEYEAIMNGTKKLDIRYHEGEYLSSYHAYGVSADIVEALNCGEYINGWGVYVEQEFANESGEFDIKQMKKHAEAINEEKEKKKKAAEEEEKQKMEFIGNAEWDIKEEEIEDEGGKTVIYHHTITINGKTFRFSERNLFDFGRLINPEYPVSEGCRGGLMRHNENGYFWDTASKTVFITDVDELRAYQIVSRYGAFSHNNIRM